MLTEKELEIMTLLWEHGPLTCSEIIKLSDSNRTWKENSIFIIMRSMMNKGYVAVEDYKPTQTRNAKVYSAVVSCEEYAVEQSVKFNLDTAEFVCAFIKKTTQEDKAEIESLLKQLLAKFS